MSDVESPSIPDKSDSQVALEIKDLEGRFSGLVYRLRTEIEEGKQEGERKLRHHFTCLPSDIKPNHHDIVKEIIKKPGGIGNVGEVFDLLNLYWNFLDYGLLEHLIMNLDSSQLKDEMSKYVADVAQFRETTTVAQFVKHWPSSSHLKSLPPYFSKLMAKLQITPTRCTLAHLERLRREFCHQFLLSSFALVVAEMHPSSVILVWYLPSSITLSLSTALRSYTGSLLRMYHVTELVLDGECVYVLPTQSEDKAEDSFSIEPEFTSSVADSTSASYTGHLTALVSVTSLTYSTVLTPSVLNFMWKG